MRTDLDIAERIPIILSVMSGFQELATPSQAHTITHTHTVMTTEAIQ